jgi:hypothetical protein
MRNLEQILAKKLLSEYKMCLEVLEKLHQNKVERGFLSGEISVLMDIAQSIWGSDELDLRSHFWFLETLTEIANGEPQANLVEVNRFEAFGLYKDYSAKSVNAMQEGFVGASQSYSERAEKWLDVAVKIEKADADDVNKNLVYQNT